MTDRLIQEIARYVAASPDFSEEALYTAQLTLADSLGCAALALQFPACTKLLGPVIPGTTVPTGCHVIGTNWILDPLQAAFNNGTLIRWLDYNDTWLAKEWGHPSDNYGALLAASEYANKTVQELLESAIQAYEIQGILALNHSFNRIGFDHVLLVKVASAAVSARLLGGGEKEIAAALSQAFIDGGPLRTYRHAPNTGSRKSWAAGDATRRGLTLAWMTMQGEQGYSTPLSAPFFGFQDALLKGEPMSLARPLGSYVMENILFKVSYPAEFHAQTAVEAAIKLHPRIQIDTIDWIEIDTHESALRIISKQGPLKNPADRDHCLEYMTAVALLKGTLTAHDYEEEAAQDPRIDILRHKMRVKEYPPFSSAYLDLNKRSIANTLRIKMGDLLLEETVEYPIGHQRRRKEALPLLKAKCHQNLSSRFPQEKSEELTTLLFSPSLLKMNVSSLLNITRFG